MGAWIETPDLLARLIQLDVAPYVGAWIETKHLPHAAVTYMSHLTWVRGLKHQNNENVKEQHMVAPYVGAWIETTGTYFVDVHEQSHLTWVRGLKLFL